jgi:multidrug efflux pump subunit AcrB
VAVVVAMFALAVVGFGNVKSGFFPDSNTPLFFVDVWEPEGSDIRKTRDDTLQVSEYIRSLPGVVQTSTVIGGPHQRFTLVYDAKEPSRAYAQIIVQTESRDQIPEVWRQAEAYMGTEMPWLDPIIKALRIGPGRDAKIEARFSGPNPEVLRQLSEKAQAIMRADNDAKDIRDDWRSPVKVPTPLFNEQVGRQLGVNRENLGGALQYAFEGTPVGTYRDGIRLLPIKMRAPDNERGDINSMRDTQVWSPVLRRSVPMSQVVTGYETRWENAVIRGRDRIQTIIASCNPRGELATPLFERLRPQIEGMELPPGYSVAWGGEYEDSVNAQKGLGGALPVGFLLMILTSIFLFGKLRQPTIIWLTVPLAIVGITAGLLSTGGAFDFMSILGALSLVGLLIKNAIVLIEEIDQQIETGKDQYEAILDSDVSRMRPVMLAAGTTILGLIPLLGALSLIGLLIKNAIVLIDEIDQQIDEGKEHLTAILDSTVSRMRPVFMAATTTILGLIPLLQDVFFVNMSITIMAGLGFATFLTLLFVPVLYSMFFRVPYSETA